MKCLRCESGKVKEIRDWSKGWCCLKCGFKWLGETKHCCMMVSEKGLDTWYKVPDGTLFIGGWEED